MKIALAQSLARVSMDPSQSVAPLADCAQKGASLGADLIIFPELALCGYSPEDLFLDTGYRERCAQALQRLARVAQVPILLGHPEFDSKHCFNSAFFLHDGKIKVVARKRHLPYLEIFDEPRYFQCADDASAEAPGVFAFGGYQLGVGVCEDFWFSDVSSSLKRQGADLLISLNASPYHHGKLSFRHQTMGERARENQLPFIYLNLAGAQDELVFDGASFALDVKGQVQVQLPQFKPHLSMVDFDGHMLAGEKLPTFQGEQEIYSALMSGLKNFVDNNGFRGVLLGLSGGVDSAVTLTLAADALGRERVHAVMLPTRHTSQMSLDDAQALANNLGVQYEIIDIEPIWLAAMHELAAPFAKQAPSTHDVTEENLQARARALVLMALSNRRGHLLLSTGNKSEIAAGYATLYGDMAGGFAPLKDVWKGWVYRLARYRNEQSHVIPERVLTRAPSAELRPNQTDQDSLPPYDILDAMMQAHVEEGQGREALIAAGFSPSMVDELLFKLRRSEFKRRQGAVGTRISRRAFGRDWRYPITCG